MAACVVFSTPFVTVHLLWVLILSSCRYSFFFLSSVMAEEWHFGEPLSAEVLDHCPWLCKVNYYYLFICLFV